MRGRTIGWIRLAMWLPLASDAKPNVLIFVADELGWADSPWPIEALQDEPAPGMPLAHALRVLDWQHGENGRLIQDCEPDAFAGGGICR